MAEQVRDPERFSRTHFVDSAELALLRGEPHATVHRALTDLLADGIAGRVSHGSAHLPSSRRYYLTTKGIGEAAGILGFDTPSDFVRAYPVSGEWLALLIRRMDAVAAIYRLATRLLLALNGTASSASNRARLHRPAHSAADDNSRPARLPPPHAQCERPSQPARPLSRR